MEDLGRRPLSRDRASNGDQRRGRAKGCRQHRATESAPRPGFRCRAAKLRAAGRDGGKGGRRISDQPSTTNRFRICGSAISTRTSLRSGDAQSSEVKDYIRDKIRSGKFLIRSIHQRQQTILQHRAADRFAAARFPRARPIAFEANDDGRSRRCRRGARDHGQPRGIRQIHGHAPGRFRDEILFYRSAIKLRPANR